MLLRIIFYFVVYGFLGWIIDTSYRSILEGSFAPGAVTSFPFTPIYGIGALVILLIHNNIELKKWWQQFIVYGAAATVVEYVGGVFTLQILGKRLWDYSSLPLNLHGHISLLHALFWGLLALLLIRVLHPKVKKFLK